MEYKEFFDLLEAGHITTGTRVWITDFRHRDIMQKPIRHIPPTHVEIHGDGKSSTPIMRTPYSVNYYFSPIGRSGKLSNKVVLPYDNTAYGEAVHVFYDLEDAKAHYRTQCEDIRRQIIEARAIENARFDRIEAELDKRLAEY